MWGCLMTLLLLSVLVFLVLLEVGCCFNASFCSVLLKIVQPLFSMRAFYVKGLRYPFVSPLILISFFADKKKKIC